VRVVGRDQEPIAHAVPAEELMTDSKSVDAVHDFDDEQEFFEERAAILEFDAGYAREDAERLARIETLTRYFEGDATMIIRKASAQGVQVRLVQGSLRASGPVDARNQWLPTLQRFRDEILSVLNALDETNAR
jgi:hypothetical protein